MRHDMFGSMQPENYADLMEMVSETGINPAATSVVVVFAADPDPTNRFNGWSAQIDGTTDEDKDVSISTCGWQDKEQLVADLKAAGFKTLLNERGMDL